jgi:hypothetical protein
MSTAKKSAPKKAVKKVARTRNRVIAAAKNIAHAAEHAVEELINDGKLSLESAIDHINFHMQERLKMSFVDNANIAKYAENAKNEILANIKKGLIHTELAGKALLDHLEKELIVPLRDEQGS